MQEVSQTPLMKPRAAFHGSTWYTASYSARAGAWAAWLQRAFYDLFPVLCIFWLAWRCAVDLLFGTSMPGHTLILPHGLNLATWTNSFKNTCGAASLFPPRDIPLGAVNKSKATTAYFSRRGPVSRTNVELKPRLSGFVHRRLEGAGCRQRWLKFPLQPELSFLCAISYRQRIGFSFAI